MKKLFLFLSISLFIASFSAFNTIYAEYKLKYPLDSFVRNDIKTGIYYITNEQERDLYRLEIKNGLIFSKDQPFDTLGLTANFVLSKDGKLYAYIEDNGHLQFRHTSLLSAEPVASAGSFKVHQGEITEIVDKSGHYQPSLNIFIQIFLYLQSENVPLKKCHFILGNVWATMEIQNDKVIKSNQYFPLLEIHQVNKLINFLGDDYVPDYRD